MEYTSYLNLQQQIITGSAILCDKNKISLETYFRITAICKEELFDDSSIELITIIFKDNNIDFEVE